MKSFKKVIFGIGAAALVAVLVTIVIKARALDRDLNRTLKPGTFKTIFVVILENTNAKRALAQPFFHKLVKEGAYLAQYHAVLHPSEPNYVAMLAGSTMGVVDDGHYDIEGRNLADLLRAHHDTWKVYAENYPGNCYKGMTSKDKKYWRKHNGFMSFSDIRNDPKRCKDHIVNAKQLATDVANGTLPNFALYIPNINDDGHDTSMAFADKALAKEFGPLLKNPRFAKGLLFVVTFDEDNARHDVTHNQIATVMVGPGVKHGSVSHAWVNHYSLLRLVETNFSLGNLGRKDATAHPIVGIWK